MNEVNEEELKVAMATGAIGLAEKMLACAVHMGLRATATALVLISKASEEYTRRVIGHQFDENASPTSTVGVAQRLANGEDVDAVLVDIAKVVTDSDVDAETVHYSLKVMAETLASTLINNAISHRGTPQSIATCACLLSDAGTAFADQVLGVQIDAKARSLNDYSRRIMNGESVDSVLRAIGNASLN